MSRNGESPTDTTVLMSERKRTSRCATGAAIPRLPHQMRAGLPGSSAASIEVRPLAVARVVTNPGSTRTLALLPGSSKLKVALLASGTGSTERGTSRFDGQRRRDAE